jgi:murein DD-endopeptidase MepM/ murein hydrolase activator NlpD
MGGNKTYDGHLGVDIDVSSFREMDGDFPILAAAPGVVFSAFDDNFDRNTSCVGAWNQVTVQHADGSRATYGHLKQNSVVVTVGQMVSVGDKLGVVGSSGCSTQAHLHLEIRDPQGVVVDPFFEGMFEAPPVYDTPLGFMDAFLYDQAITGFAMVKDPAPNISTLTAGQTLGVGLSLAGGEAGDVVNLRLVAPGGSVARFTNITFGQVWRHTYWWWNVGTNLMMLPGTYAVEIRLNGVLAKSYQVDLL